MNNEFLSNSQINAVKRFKEEVSKKYKTSNIIIFDSTVRGKAEEGSDLDVLLITERILGHRERHAVYEIATKINWEYDTNISVTVVDKYNWEKGIYTILPLKEEVLQDGVVV